MEEEKQPQPAAPAQRTGLIPLSEKQNPDPDQTPIVTLGNLTVRAMRAADAERMAQYANDPAISKRMRDRFPSPYQLVNAQTWINTANDASMFAEAGAFSAELRRGTDAPIPTKFAICLDDQFIGNVGLEFMDDVACRCAELGYWVGQDFWGRGIMGAVVPAFVAWAWRSFGRLLRLEGGVFEGNPGSCRVLEKAGFVRYATLRKAVWKNGRSLAIDVFEMVREEED